MLSNKLMTMKFMTNTKGDVREQALQGSPANDTHWKLDFKKPQKAIRSDIIVDSSYSSLDSIESGRRKFSKNPIQESDDNISKKDTAELTSDQEDAPEDIFARRRAEKETDSANIKKLKGLTSLSGPSGTKRKHLSNMAGDSRGRRRSAKIARG